MSRKEKNWWVEKQSRTLYWEFKHYRDNNIKRGPNVDNSISCWVYVTHLTLPRRGYRFCGSEGGGFWRNQWWSGLRPYVAIHILLKCKFRTHMQTFGPPSQKLGEISRFKNLVRLRFHVTLVYKNCHNSLNFEATGLIFCMQAWFW